MTASPGPVPPESDPVPSSKETKQLTALLPRDHAIDVRLSILVLGRRYYFVVLAGTELRSAARRARERTLHPLLTLGNVLFLGGVVAAIYAFSLVVLVVLNGMTAG